MEQACGMQTIHKETALSLRVIHRSYLPVGSPLQHLRHLASVTCSEFRGILIGLPIGGLATASKTLIFNGLWELHNFQYSKYDYLFSVRWRRYRRSLSQLCSWQFFSNSSSSRYDGSMRERKGRSTGGSTDSN